MAARNGRGVPDTDEMIVVHRLFMQEYRAAVPLVREVRPGDRTRSAVVADHLDALDAMLTEHHLAETNWSGRGSRPTPPSNRR